MGGGGEGGWEDAARQPAGFILQIRNSGHRPAVIDAVDFVGNAGYPSPSVVTLRALSHTNCGGAFALRAVQRPALPPGCGARDLGPLIGHTIPFSSADFPAMVAIAAAQPPAPDQCWALTAVVIHYHVGIRHYTATDPDALAVCSGRAISSMQRVMDAAGTAAPG